VTFLTSAWFAALEERLATAPARTGERIGIGQVITGGPDGDVSYTIVIGGDAPAHIERGTVAQATVTLIEDYDTAAAIATGEPVAGALGAGQIKVRGDANALVAAYDLLAALQASEATD
jgi:hypothetical protein